MTYEQTREQFLLAWNSNAYLNMCESDDMHNAIVALEKQIPKKPKYEDVDNIYGAIKRTCTACGDVCMVSKGAKPYEHYCRQCGQALDWSDNND